MTELGIHQVDAFTDRLFRGNPAAVVLLEEGWPDDGLLKEIAAENNLSETAFVLPHPLGPSGADPTGGEGHPPVFGLRWFTPTVEVDLCGHATLAAAWVLFEEGLAPGEVVFESASGPLPVRREEGLIWLDFPSRPPEPTEWGPALEEALGVRPAEVHRARDLVVVLDAPEAVAGLEPDLAAVGRLDVFAVCVTARGGPGGADFVSRFFAPAAGVPEDPVTGSAHATLAPFWAGRIGRRKLRARQLSERGGELLLRVEGERVSIGGRAVGYLRGTIRTG